MGGRRSKLIAIAAAALAVGGLAPTTAHAANRRCYPGGADALGASSHVRLYQVMRGDTARVVACARRSGRRQVVHEYFDDAESFALDEVRFSGLAVAIAFHGCLGTSCGASVRSVDIRSRAAREWGEGGVDRVTDLVVKPNGSVAWIDSDAGAAGARRVRKLDASSSMPVQLDSGPAIDSISLALARSSRLYWTNADVPRSATLQ